MSADIAKQMTPIEVFVSQLQGYEKKILPDLLKAHNMDAAQFKHTVIKEVRSNPKLLQAFIENPSSLFASIIAGAEIGLTPSEMLGEFFIIPRNIKQANNSYLMTAVPMIGYKGIIGILYRSGDVVEISTECVFEGDKFEVSLGTDRKILHVPNFDVPRNAEKIKYVYATATMKNGEKQFTVLTRQNILAIKDTAKYNNELYFNDKKSPNYWMERKTAVIQLSKMLPKDYYAKKAVELDNRLTGGALLSMDEQNQIILLNNKGIEKKKKSFLDVFDASLIPDKIQSEENPETE